MNGPTIGDLLKAKEVSENQLYTAVTACVIDPTMTLYPIAEGIVVNPAAAVKAHSPAKRILANPDAPEAAKRKAVRNAILAARPVPA